MSLCIRVDRGILGLVGVGKSLGSEGMWGFGPKQLQSNGQESGT